MLKKICLFLVLFLFIKFSGIAEIIDFGEIVITSERLENTLRNSNKNIYIITADDIKNRGITNIFDVFKITPGAIARDWTGGGKKGSIDLRGQGEAANNNILILIDGVSINPIDMSGPDYSQISIEQIDRIEILPGGGGILYGDKAIGGVINIITKSAKETDVKASAKLEFGSYNFFNKGFDLNYKSQNFSVLAAYYHKNFDGYRENSEHNAHNANLKFNFNITDYLKSSYSIHYNKDDYGLPGALTYAQMQANRRQSINPLDNVHTKNIRQIFGLKFKNGNFAIDNNLSYYIQKIQNEIVSWYGFGFGNEKIDNKKIANHLTFKFEKNREKLIAGIDYQNSNSETNNANKIKKENLGLYILNNYRILENLAFSVGGRKEKTELTYYANNKQKKYDEDIYEAGLNYYFNNDANVYFNISENYRTPVTDEYYTWGAYLENLEPQKGTNIELGLRAKLKEKYNFFVSAYTNATEKEIFYNPTTWANDNMPGKTKREGIEFLSEQQFTENITARQSYSRIYAKFSDGPYKDKKVPGVPNNIFSYEVLTKFPKLVNVLINYYYADGCYPISDFTNSSGKTESYSVVNLNFNKQINNLIFNCGINNIFNEKYSQYIVVDYGFGKNYYPSPERNYYANISYKF